MNNLVAIIEKYEQQALGGENSTLSVERAKALDVFLGNPYGNEQEGRSQVVSRDAQTVVGWMLPGLIKVFMSGDEVVRFEPRDNQDVPGAEQETQYVNYVILEKNNAFNVIHNWILDGLISKNGYIKVDWEDENEVSEEVYEGLTDEELAMLMQNDQIEVVEHTQSQDQFGPLHAVRIRVQKENGLVRMENVPPEEILVDDNQRTVSLLEANFVEHRRLITLSELREMGYDVSDDIGSDEEFIDVEHQTRNLYNEAGGYDTEPAMRQVMYREAYVRTDEDGDGIAELRKVCIVGREILHNEVVDIVPFAAWTPYPMPHRHIGMSAIDKLKDIQEIKTVLLRNAIDAQFLAVHPRYAIDASRVSLDDMLVSRPGGIVRADGDPVGAIMPLTSPVDGTRNLGMLTYFDEITANRTGVSNTFQGIDKNALNTTATGVQQLMSAAQSQVELIARNLSESGFKDLARLVHKTIQQHARRAEMIRLRNQWVNIDPRTWAERKDMSVSVGLGTGNKDQQLAHLQTILMAQKEAIAIGVATPQNIYNALKRLTVNAGFKTPEEFWTDPSTQPQQQPKTDPIVQAEQIKQQGEMQKLHINAQLEKQKQDAAMQQEQLRSQNDVAIEQNRIQAQMELERWKAELEAQTALQKARMEIEAKIQMENLRMKNQAEMQIFGGQQ